MSGIDLPSLDEQDIDFSQDTVTGLTEYRQAALRRIVNAVTYDDNDFGVDVIEELGAPASATYTQTLGLRCSAAILNDDRFDRADVTRVLQENDGATVTATLEFNVVVGDGTTFDLAVLVAGGEVTLVEDIE